MEKKDGQRDYLDNYITPENQKRMAFELNDLQRSIVDYIVRNGRIIQSNEKEGWETDISKEGDCLRISAIDISGGDQIDTGIIHYLHKTKIYQTTGIQTNDIIFVGRYPDKKTYEQVRMVEKFPKMSSLSIFDSMLELERKLNQESLDYPQERLNRFFDWGTVYLTDNSGNFAKFGVIPDYLLLGRNNIRIFEEYIPESVIVEYPMQLRDFSIARTALINMYEVLSVGHNEERPFGSHKQNQEGFDINNPNF